MGLTAAIVTLTWIFSGLLSMNPFKVFSPRSALHSEHLQWQGPKAAVMLTPAQALMLSDATDIKEMDVVQVAGQSWYRLWGVNGQTLVRADRPISNVASQVLNALPDETIQVGLLGLRPGAGTSGSVALTKLSAYDNQYYAREVTENTRYTRPLPVWRAQWPDGVAMYADPTSGKLLLRADESNRWQRVLYNGLHSFDFAPLLSRPWLRDALILIFSMLGTALCVTSCVIAWRVLVPRKRRSAEVKPH